MTFCIVSHVYHTAKDGRYYGYGPYIREMNIWFKYTDSVIVVAPLNEQKIDAIQLAYNHPNITFISVPHFSFTSFKNSWKALIVIPFIFFKILQAFRKADHLHLRCPGNMGLLGAMAQLFFPKKVKTAKYAGNWDPNAKQPLTYKWQKALLANSFLTKRMQVLVYGDWPNQSKNIKSFFTASYPESEPWPAHNKTLSNPMQLIFVGSLVQGKNPLYAVKILEYISALGYNAKLNIYGEGILRGVLTDYIIENDLDQQVYLQGNVDAASLKVVYEQSHFLLLPSQSEGWPKVVAEAMFWGCIPAATAVSCVSNMLDHENRGIILSMDLNRDAEKIVAIWNNSSHYQQIRTHGIQWSRKYTTTAFEDAIKKLMQV
jgi:glycosyltransferase involved in cell wall biosynthesis